MALRFPMAALAAAASVGLFTPADVGVAAGGALLEAEVCRAGLRFDTRAWPSTDFSRCTVPLAGILSGGPPKDGIPPIDAPRTRPVADESTLTPTEPVISLELNGEARAWPLRILTWHEIVNDELGGVPIAVTYCPLCNAAIVFDRRVGGDVLDFGTTGKLRNSDLVMYDRQSESWWQQYTGEAIAGKMAGTRLKRLPARLESWQLFAGRHPDADVLVPSNPRLRTYGANPYVGYDGAGLPFLYDGDLPTDIAPMARVVVVGDRAWALDWLRARGDIETGGLRLAWQPGQNSALDTRAIPEGRDVGTVSVQTRTATGWSDIPYDVTFAFVFRAFNPDGEIVGVE